MGFSDFLKVPAIKQGFEEYKATPNALLVDVRTPQEYREGHVPDSRNIPLQVIDSIKTIVPQTNTPLFVYCHSVARSSQATAMLGEMRYTNVKNIGGIVSYKGKVDK